MIEKPITFQSGRSQIVGILHLPDRKTTYEKFPAVIFCHGFSGNKSESHFIFTKTARQIASCGLACLRFDFMGSGDSAGSFEEMTLETEIFDAFQAYEYLAGLPFINKENIGILGLSMGAIPAVIVASKIPLKSLCLWAPVAYPEEISKKILTAAVRKKLQQQGTAYLNGAGLRIGKHFINSLKKINPVEAASRFCGHTLIIHSKDDPTINVSHALAYYKAFHNAAITKRMIILEKGGHTFVTEQSENIVIQETASSFTQTLIT
ncbi:MAG TPA: prolyl oligopeptidase family serine peptidase [bacterium]|nr:prolyl oligopeptidase family serine peptidase [bacterium]HOL49541.1 prolyl oligopeptidase family serine peptidase [bacterium]HPO52517.1 prolyl oligopeptidase family serine peptidase [bacterium]HXK44358.1 prolyl oligopeptidase family serine peptidase [bacterium]